MIIIKMNRNKSNIRSECSMRLPRLRGNKVLTHVRTIEQNRIGWCGTGCYKAAKYSMGDVADLVKLVRLQ